MDRAASRTVARCRQSLILLCLSLSGCPNAELAPLAPCTVSGVADSVTRGADDGVVDLLFVVDNSGSMEFEQATLARALPELVRSLAAGEIRDRDGKVTRRFTPVKSLHLGVTSSDMGANDVDTRTDAPRCGVDSASKRPRGDDGLLLATVDAEDPLCTKPDSAYLNFSVGMDPDALSRDFGCMTRLGIEGCGYEQQLEAMWKALAPSANDSFFGHTRGHGDAENAGFLRPNSVIAVIQVTDEEDCSIPESSSALFDQDIQGENKNVSCQQNPTLLHPVERFVAGLKSLRPNNHDRVVFAAIAGVPVQAAEELKLHDGSQDFDALLALEEMQFNTVRDPERRILAKPACTFNGADAAPARRFIEVAKGFGRNGVVRSICQDDFTSALSAITDKIADQLQGACLERKLIADPDTGLAPCGIVEYLSLKQSSPSDCDIKRGRRFLRRQETEGGATRIVCQVNQLAVNKTKMGCDAGSAAGETEPTDCLEPNRNAVDALENPAITQEILGWYYDDFTEQLKQSAKCNEQRIAFTENAEQAAGSEMRFECLQPVFSVFADAKGVDAVNKPCENAPEVCTAARDASYRSLFCDPSLKTCQIACEESAICPDSWACDTTRATPICVNPVCPQE